MTFPAPLARRTVASAALALIVALAGCATPPADPLARAAYDEANDPIEPFNRSMFEFNMGLDKYFLKPVASTYKDVVPDGMREALTSFLRNLRSPLIFANDLLQGEPRRAGLTMERFLLNTTVGFGGFVDVADRALGVPYHNEDFGQTLAVWGAGEGPYLVLPLLGPSNARDAGGYLVDTVTDPVSLALQYYGFGVASVGRFALTALDTRTEALGTYDSIKDTSIDFYASLRSLYRQRRKEDIKNGRAEPQRPDTSAGAAIGGADDIVPSGTPAARPATAGGADDIIPSGPPRTEMQAAPPGQSAPATPVQPAPVAMAPPAAQQQLAAQPALAMAPPAPAAAARFDPCGVLPAAFTLQQAAGVIYFANGSSVLTPEAHARLSSVAAEARRRNAVVHVVGHASERTGELDPVRHRLINFDVSWFRAAAAGEALERAGLPASRLVVEARSDQEPVCLETMPSGEAANRRVALYLE